MTQVSRHAGLTGSELVRWLARLAGPEGLADASKATPAFASQLSQWLGWTDAVALASALDVGVAAGRPVQHDAAARLLDEVQRVRAALVKAISISASTSISVSTSQRYPSSTAAQRGPMAAGSGGRSGSGARALGGMTASSADDPTDFATHRRQVHQHQQAMDAAVSRLRARLRAALMEGSPPLARLAAVDGVMEQALLPQVQRLTSTVTALLERRFRGLQGTQAAQVAQVAQVSEPPSLAWLDVFRQDQEAVLLAELDFRFQPIEGLMSALRSTWHAAPGAALQTT